METCANIECYLDSIRTYFITFSQNLGVNPFWLYFFAGAVVLILYSRDRLDRSLETRLVAKDGETQRAGRQSQNAAGAKDFEAFVRTFRPSQICISRAFFGAWVAYAVLLILLYSAVSFVIALFAGILTLEQAFGGLSEDHLATSHLAQSTTTAVSFLSTIEVPEVVEPPAETASESGDQDVAEWPLLIALMVVGLIPAIPRVRKVEHAIRNFSLQMVGIPRDVVDLWRQLSRTPILPSNEIDRASVLAELSNDRGELVKSAQDYATRFAGEENIEENRDRLVLNFLFLDWTKGEPPWPDIEVKALYDRGDLDDVTRSIEAISRDLRHFVAVSALVDDHFHQRTTMVHGLAEAPGAFEMKGDKLAGDLPAGLDLAERWAEVSERAAVVAEQVRAKIALYAERVAVLPNRGKFSHLYDWIESAKQTPAESGPDLPQRRRHTGIVLLCVLVYGIFGVLEPSVVDFLASTNSVEAIDVDILQNVWGVGVPRALEAIAYFFAAGLAVKWLRDDPALRLDWKRLGTSGWAWSYLNFCL